MVFFVTIENFWNLGIKKKACGCDDMNIKLFNQTFIGSQ